MNDNELIAEFMGWKCYPENKSYSYPQWYKPDPKDLRKKGQWKGYPHQLAFDLSWDWLMPVVEKIEKTTTYVIEIWLSGGKGCRICFNNNGKLNSFIGESNSTIEAVYDAVLQFIKWHKIYGVCVE